MAVLTLGWLCWVFFHWYYLLHQRNNFGSSEIEGNILKLLPQMKFSNSEPQNREQQGHYDQGIRNFGVPVILNSPTEIPERDEKFSALCN